MLIGGIIYGLLDPRNGELRYVGQSALSEAYIRSTNAAPVITTDPLSIRGKDR